MELTTVQILQEVPYIRDVLTLLPEHHVEAGDDEEKEEPEPEGDEDLVIDHVDRKDTEAVKSKTVTRIIYILIRLI